MQTGAAHVHIFFPGKVAVSRTLDFSLDCLIFDITFCGFEVETLPFLSTGASKINNIAKFPVVALTMVLNIGSFNTVIMLFLNSFKYNI